MPKTKNKLYNIITLLVTIIICLFILEVTIRIT